MASRPFGMQRQILIHLADGLVALVRDLFRKK
jgi:hypothetical protein